MPVRTTSTTATFALPFRLKGVGEMLPPGTYQVETDEEAVESNERTVFLRIATPASCAHRIRNARVYRRSRRACRGDRSRCEIAAVRRLHS